MRIEKCKLCWVAVALNKIDMSCNENKTVSMIFQSKHHSQIVSVSFPQLTLCNFCVKYVSSFKYLGHNNIFHQGGQMCMGHAA